jgi:hypothetical protein
VAVLGVLVKATSVVAVCAAVAVLGKHFGVVDRVKEIFGKGGKKRDNADIVKLSALPAKERYDSEKAKEEFAEKSFTDVYESIYRVSQGQTKRSNDILEDLNSRIHYLKDSPNVQAFWRSLFTGYERFTPEKLKETTAEFIKFVFEAGIKRDNSEQVTVDETTHYKYYNSGDGDFVKGEKMKVERAFWSLGDKILEKGVLTSL